MALTNSKSAGLLARSVRARRPIVVSIGSAKRYLESASDGASRLQNEALPLSMVPESSPPELESKSNPIFHKDDMAADLAKDDMMIEQEDQIRPPRAVQLAYLRPLKRTPEHRIPTCNLQLRSYSARNLEFFTSFALRAAYYLNLPAVGPVPLPRQVERWTVPRGHFIHKKSQENFERITMRRLIQIQDGHPETIQMWLAYLKKRQYYGVGMKANVWQFEKLSCGKDMDVQADKGQSLEERWQAEFSSGLTPDVQAKVDEWIAEHAPGEERTMSPLADGSAEDSSIAIQSAGQSPEESTQTPIPEEGASAGIELQSQSQTEVASSSAEATKSASAEAQQLERKAVLSEAQKLERILSQVADEAAQAEKSSKKTKTAKTAKTTKTKRRSSKVNPAPLGDLEATLDTPQAKPELEASAPDAAVSRSATEAAKESSPQQPIETAPVKEEPTPPAASETDTSKNIETPEEADPSVEPITEQAKEAEAEDAEQPLGGLPKTPS